MAVTVTVTKTFIDEDTGDELMYLYTITQPTYEEANDIALLYVSMVEYGTAANHWMPSDDMAFRYEDLYQFIQKGTLDQLVAMYPETVTTAYRNALAYVHSEIGAMFDIDAMLNSDDVSATSMTLRLALCMKTAWFCLASSAQYSEVTEQNEAQIKTLLKGLKSGSRNMGKAGLIAEPNVRGTIVSQGRKSNLP